ncbi:MAG: MOSC domain-containing protein [Cellvibrionaceae bacterium]
MAITITQLFVFPVKSLRGIAIQDATLSPTGFKWDRHWMIVKPDGGFISQRQFPQMVLIKTKIENEQLILSKVGMSDFHLDLNQHNDSPVFTGKVWKDYCDVVDEGEDSSQWLTEAIGAPTPLRLVRMADGHQRPQSKPELLGEATTTKFADAAPFLVCNQASLDALNQSMVRNDFSPVTMEHFRPNIVIEGVGAFEEHQIKAIEHKQYQLKHCYPCQRCAVPTIDITKGQRHPQQQPFSLISELNSMPENAKAPAFGENAILIQGNNQTIRVGDQLKEVYENIN